MIKNQPKERSDDRILVLKTQDGKNTLSNTGLIDNRLFTGENKLHAVLEQDTNLWKLKYDNGIVPEALRQKFTSFAKLKSHCEAYFNKRNIEIEKVID